MDNEGSGAPAGSQNSPAGNPKPRPRERLIIHVCIVKLTDLPRIILYGRNVALLQKAMAAAHFSRDVLEMFCGPILNEIIKGSEPQLAPK